MAGPIVRSAPSLQFSDNWEKIFGKKKSGKKSAKKAAKTKPKGRKKAAPKGKSRKK